MLKVCVRTKIQIKYIESYQSKLISQKAVIFHIYFSFILSHHFTNKYNVTLYTCMFSLERGCYFDDLRDYLDSFSIFVNRISHRVKVKQCAGCWAKVLEPIAA